MNSQPDNASLQKEWSVVTLFVHCIYGAVIFYAAIVHLRLIVIPPAMKEQAELFFMVFLAAALAQFPAALFIGGGMVSADKLREAVQRASDKKKGLLEAMKTVKTAAILMSAMGEAIGVFGLILFLITGDTVRPWFFFGLCGFHYVGTMMKLKSVREELDRF